MKRIAWMWLLLAVSICGGAAIPNCERWVQQHFAQAHHVTNHPHHSPATLRRWRIYNLTETLKRYQLACGDVTPIPTVDVEGFVPVLAAEVPVFTEQPSGDEIATLDVELESLIPPEDATGSDEVAMNGFPFYWTPFMILTPPVYSSLPPSTPVPEIPTLAMVITGILFIFWRKSCYRNGN